MRRPAGVGLSTRSIGPRLGDPRRNIERTERLNNLVQNAEAAGETAEMHVGSRPEEKILACRNSAAKRLFEPKNPAAAQPFSEPRP
jgi:hypothetical protein